MTLQLPPGSDGRDATLAEAAVSYATGGRAVLPVHWLRNGRCSCGSHECPAAGKHPRTPRGYLDATVLEAVIRKTWQVWPEANIGLRTGPAGGFAALDVDPRNGGDETLAELEASHEPLPPTVTVATGGGGRHFYFQDPGGEPCRSAILGRGLELKRDGGYVIAPPSIHRSGQPYRFVSAPGTPIAALPSWLLKHARRPPAARNGSGATHPPEHPITDGERNTFLTSQAGAMRRRGISLEAIQAALPAENQARCEPPLPEDEVQGIARGMARYTPGAAERKPSSQATRLVDLGQSAAFFHSPESEAYATVSAEGHRETWPLRSRRFRVWLARQFFQRESRVPSSQALEEALGILEGEALFCGDEQQVFVRVAQLERTIYVDLANDHWEAVEVTPEGWGIVSDPAVKFRRPRGLKPLPVPVAGGSLLELRRFVNVANESDWRLVVAWLLTTFRGQGPFPVLILHGEQGAAKSTTAEFLRDLIDPSTAPLRAEPRDPRDLMIAATNSHVVALDNLSHLPPWLSDALCRLSTGGGFVTRELWTDAEQVFFDAQRPVILTGIVELATRADLLDRALILYLPPIAAGMRRPEADLQRDFEAARPRILGALFDAVVAGLRELPSTSLQELPRMADFALWATACEAGLGWERGVFAQAYSANREAANDLVLDTSPVAEAVRGLVRSGPWSGTASELLSTLTRFADPGSQQQRGWPKSPSALSGALHRITPNLRAEGVHVFFIRRGRARTIYIEQRAELPSSPSSPSLDQVSLALTRPQGGARGDGPVGPVTGTSGAPSPESLQDAQPSDGDDGDDGPMPPCSGSAPEGT